MFGPRVRSRLLERYERQFCEKIWRRKDNGGGCESSFGSWKRGYATGKSWTNGNADDSRVVRKPISGSTSFPRTSLTTTTTTTSPTATRTRTAEVRTKATEVRTETSSTALRTAEARDSALRAARMRRLAQKQDRLAEDAKRGELKREYKKRYDVAARKWISTIIALPILLVTSYYLFDRLVLGNEPKSLEKYREDK